MDDFLNKRRVLVSKDVRKSLSDISRSSLSPSFVASRDKGGVTTSNFVRSPKARFGYGYNNNKPYWKFYSDLPKKPFRKDVFRKGKVRLSDGSVLSYPFVSFRPPRWRRWRNKRIYYKKRAGFAVSREEFLSQAFCVVNSKTEARVKNYVKFLLRRTLKHAASGLSKNRAFSAVAFKSSRKRIVRKLIFATRHRLDAFYRKWRLVRQRRMFGIFVRKHHWRSYRIRHLRYKRFFLYRSLIRNSIVGLSVPKFVLLARSLGHLPSSLHVEPKYYKTRDRTFISYRKSIRPRARLASYRSQLLAPWLNHSYVSGSVGPLVPQPLVFVSKLFHLYSFSDIFYKRLKHYMRRVRRRPVSLFGYSYFLNSFFFSKFLKRVPRVNTYFRLRMIRSHLMVRRRFRYFKGLGASDARGHSRRYLANQLKTFSLGKSNLAFSRFNAKPVLRKRRMALARKLLSKRALFVAISKFMRRKRSVVNYKGVRRNDFKVKNIIRVEKSKIKRFRFGFAQAEFRAFLLSRKARFIRMAKTFYKNRYRLFGVWKRQRLFSRAYKKKASLMVRRGVFDKQRRLTRGGSSSLFLQRMLILFKENPYLVSLRENIGIRFKGLRTMSRKRTVNLFAQRHGRFFSRFRRLAKRFNRRYKFKKPTGQDRRRFRLVRFRRRFVKIGLGHSLGVHFRRRRSRKRSFLYRKGLLFWIIRRRRRCRYRLYINFSNYKRLKRIKEIFRKAKRKFTQVMPNPHIKVLPLILRRIRPRSFRKVFRVIYSRIHEIRKRRFVFLSIKQTVNNLFITAVDNKTSKVVLTGSAGKQGFKGTSRMSHYSLEKFGRRFGRRLLIKTRARIILLFRSRYNRLLRSFLKGFFLARLTKIAGRRYYHHVVAFRYLVRVAHNGLRKRKKRRK